jgi:hypothetical protein
MRLIKTVATVMFTLLLTNIYAQKEDMLLGKWNVKYEDSKETAIYEIVKDGSEFKGYSIQYTDEKGVLHKEKELIFPDITFDGNSGESEYKVTYEGKLYNIDGKFTLKDPTTIILSYSYWGYKGREVWTKID